MESSLKLYPVILVLLVFYTGATLIQAVCDDGFQYNNATNTCYDINECKISAKTPCVKGSCINVVGGFYCLCPPGRFGVTCDSFTETACGDIPAPGCQNGGTCIGSRCLCMDGYYGDYCQYMESSSCSMTCINDGICVMDPMGTPIPFCLCPYGHHGSYCQYKLDLCAGNVCLNGGTCVKNMDRPCKCSEMYSGTYCEHTVNDTLATCDECFGKASCDETTKECTCHPEFTGVRCQFLTDCTACGEGAVCVPTLTLPYFKCVCPEGTSGTQCSNDDVDECQSMPCMNGGICINQLGFYSCSCSSSYYGVNCEEESVSLVSEEYALGVALYTGCSVSNCSSSAANEACDDVCNTEECLYDVLECTPTPDACFNMTQCMTGFDDNDCSSECGNVTCGSDGLDCVDNKRYPSVVLGTLVFDMMVAPTNISEMAIFSTILPYYVSVSLLNPVLYIRRYTTDSEPGTGALMINNKTESADEGRFDVYCNVGNNPDCGSNDTYPCWTNITYVAQYVAEIISKKPEIYTGFTVNAIRVCMEGYWGDTCSYTCSSTCNNTYPRVCSMIDGDCNHGCMSGYSGSNCSTKCSENCLTSDPQCNSTTGECWVGSGYRCKAGFMGLTCDEACESGTYGKDCSQNCSSNCADTCSTTDGSCTCKSGYQGSMCTQTCSSGYYGLNCSMTCSACRYGNTCDPVTGNCTACPSGKHGGMCQYDCSNTTYGYDCAQTCSTNCVNQLCDNVNGDCSIGCVTGYTGSKCSSKQVTATTPTTADYSSTVIAVIIVLVILIVVALGIAYFLWRRSQGGEYDIDDDKKLEDYPLKEMKPNDDGGPVDNVVVENEAGLNGGPGGEKHPLVDSEDNNTVDLDKVETRPTSLAPGGVFVGEDKPEAKAGGEEQPEEPEPESNPESAEQKATDEGGEDKKDTPTEEATDKADDESAKKEEDQGTDENLPPPPVDNSDTSDTVGGSELLPDTGPPSDTGPPPDTTPPSDTAPPSDTTPPSDTAPPSDTSPPSDTTPPSDTAPPPDGAGSDTST